LIRLDGLRGALLPEWPDAEPESHSSDLDPVPVVARLDLRGAMARLIDDRSSTAPPAFRRAFCLRFTLMHNASLPC
jgi:hypothetical protein